MTTPTLITEQLRGSRSQPPGRHVDYDASFYPHLPEAVRSHVAEQVAQCVLNGSLDPTALATFTQHIMSIRLSSGFRFSEHCWGVQVFAERGKAVYISVRYAKELESGDNFQPVYHVTNTRHEIDKSINFQPSAFGMPTV